MSQPPAAGASTGWTRLLAALAAALALRLIGIRWGLPLTFNADEPHIVNLAVSFGGGSLRPYAFKYPTLWPYALFVVYGVYFLLWSGLGLRRSLLDFIGLFSWHRTGFYLIGRLLAVAAQVAGIAIIGRCQQRPEPRWPLAAALLAVSPALVELAHSLKPDSAMFLLVCAGYSFALRVYEAGARRDYLLGGACFGLALSCQFLALPACLLLPLAHALSKRRGDPRWLFGAAAACACAFFAGSPYVLLDPGRFWFWASMRDPAELAAWGSFSPGRMLLVVLGNAANFAGVGSAAGILACAGLWRVARRDGRRAVLLAAPVVAYAAILAGSPDGAFPRRLAGCLPSLALLAAEGAAGAPMERRLLGALLALTALGPGLGQSLLVDAQMRRPDTRQLAGGWIRSEIPAGSTVLVDQAFAEPGLAMSADELAELADRTGKSGSPRARLYRGMAATHPGGGYRLLLIARSARDLGTYGRHARLAQADSPTLDVSAGLAAARSAGVSYVITSSFGAAPERAPELAAFFDELYREGRLLAAFAPQAGRVEGPVLRVFKIARRR